MTALKRNDCLQSRSEPCRQQKEMTALLTARAKRDDCLFVLKARVHLLLYAESNDATSNHLLWSRGLYLCFGILHSVALIFLHTHTYSDDSPCRVC